MLLLPAARCRMMSNVVVIWVLTKTGVFGSCKGRVGHAGMGWGGSWRGGVGDVGVGWVM